MKRGTRHTDTPDRKPDTRAVARYNQIPGGRDQQADLLNQSPTKVNHGGRGRTDNVKQKRGGQPPGKAHRRNQNSSTNQPKKTQKGQEAIRGCYSGRRAKPTCSTQQGEGAVAKQPPRSLYTEYRQCQIDPIQSTESTEETHMQKGGQGTANRGSESRTRSSVKRGDTEERGRKEGGGAFTSYGVKK